MLNSIRHRQWQQTYRRRKKESQRLVREFERRQTAEALEAAWAHRYWNDSRRWVKFLPTVIDRVPMQLLRPDQVPVVEELYAEVRPGDPAGRWPETFECVRCHQVIHAAEFDPRHAGVCRLCVAEVMADPPDFKPDLEAADPYWGPG